MRSLSISERLEHVDGLFVLLRSRIGQKHHDGVRHYLDHGEPEIACELLAAGAWDSCSMLEPGEKRQLRNLCLECGVDTADALNPALWEKIDSYLTS